MLSTPPEIPATVYYPSLPEPIPVPNHDDKMKEQIKKIEETSSNQDFIKSCYESRTREMILNQSKASLDLFKIIHEAMQDLTSKNQVLSQSINELAKITKELMERFNIVLDELAVKAKPEPLVQPQEVKRTSSFVGSKRPAFVPKPLNKK